MERKFLEHYNTELHYLREMSGEFARKNPKIAKRLMLDEFDCKDPYVERMLEGFAYMAARIQYKMSTEFSSFSQSLVDSIFPQYYNPAPSCTIVQFLPDYKRPDLAKGVFVKAGTLLKSHPCGADRQVCKFKTISDLALHPIEISFLKYNIGVIEEKLGVTSPVRASMELSLSTPEKLKISQLNIDSLKFYIRSPVGNIGMMLYEQIFGNCLNILFQSKNGGKKYAEISAAFLKDHLKQVGFSESESIFPIDKRTFEGHRLLREYYLFPQKFMFFELTGISEILKKCEEPVINIIFLFNKSSNMLKNLGKENLCLFCCPAVNLFKSTLSRVAINRKDAEFYIPADRVYPLDYEILQIESVDGYSANYSSRLDFLPFYSDSDFKSNRFGKKAFYSYKRMPRSISEREKEEGTRTSYIGSELYLSIIDTANLPYKGVLEELGVIAWCSNRDLPMLMNIDEYETDFELDISLPIRSIQCIEIPTAPKMPFDVSQWQVINNIAVNFFSFLTENNEVNIENFRSIQKMYTYSEMDHNMIENGIDSIVIKSIVRRVSSIGPILFGRGFSVDIFFNEETFSGSGFFLLGSVLDRFFGAKAPINSFTETRIFSKERGIVVKWPIRVGYRQIL